MRTFSGVKIALICQGQVLVILRDNKPGIPFAGWWDLPGGGREGTETPVQCALREVQEELGLQLSPQQVVWQKPYPRQDAPDIDIYFMVAYIRSEDIARVAFGTEGQAWRMQPIASFMQDPQVIGQYKPRLQQYINSLQSRA